MILLSKQKFDDICKEQPYFNGRWVYFDQVLTIINKYFKHYTKILEIGHNGCQLVEESQTIDIQGNPTYNFDVREKWPLESKSYQLGIALQVWEHLLPKRYYAFTELKRVCENAIISVPYHWNVPKDKIHHNVTMYSINKWFDMQFLKEAHVVGKWNTRRIILLFQFYNQK